MRFAQILDSGSLNYKVVVLVFIAPHFYSEPPHIAVTHLWQPRDWQLVTSMAWRKEALPYPVFVSTEYNIQYCLDTSLNGCFPFAAQRTTWKGTENEESKREQWRRWRVWWPGFRFTLRRSVWQRPFQTETESQAHHQPDDRQQPGETGHKT